MATTHCAFGAALALVASFHAHPLLAEPAEPDLPVPEGPAPEAQPPTREGTERPAPLPARPIWVQSETTDEPEVDRPATEAPEPKSNARRGVVPIVHAGYRMGGGGKASMRCTGDCASPTSVAADYSEALRPVLGVDVLYHADPAFRFGPGLLYSPSTAADFGDGMEELGSDLSLVLVAEALVPLNASISLTLRGQAGLLTLYPGGDLERGIDALRAGCATAGGRCSVDEGPYTGLTLGGGAGLLFGREPMGLRLDFLLQWYQLDGLQKTTGTGATGSYLDAGIDMAGTRYMVALGGEF